MSKPTTMTVATVARRILAILDDYPPNIQRGSMRLVALSVPFDNGVKVPVHVVGQSPDNRGCLPDAETRRFIDG